MSWVARICEYLLKSSLTPITFTFRSGNSFV